MPFGGLLTVGLIGAGSQIGSGLLGSSAARTAAKQQRDSALQAQGIADQNTLKSGLRLDQNTDTGLSAITGTRGMVNDAFAPYQAVGETSATGLNSALQNPFQFNMQDDPGYQFRLQQGQKAIEQSAAARGGAASGGALKALTQYGQGFASNEYQNAFNRHQTQLQNLFQGAGLGLSASGQDASLNAGLTGDELNTLGQNSSLNANILGQNSQLASQNFTGAGNAQAAGTVGSANAIGGAVNGAGQTANQLFLYNLLKNPGGTGATPTFMQNVEGYA